MNNHRLRIKENRIQLKSGNRSSKGNCQTQYQSIRPGYQLTNSMYQSSRLKYQSTTLTKFENSNSLLANLVDYTIYQLTNPCDQSTIPNISRLVMCTVPCARPFCDLRSFIYLHDVFQSQILTLWTFVMLASFIVSIKS